MKLKANEQKEYQEIVEKYSNMVYRLSYFYTNSKYDADDIYQDVFLKYLQNTCYSVFIFTILYKMKIFN